MNINMSDKQKDVLKQLEKLGEIVAMSKIRSMLFVDVCITQSNGDKYFDTYKIYRNGKCVLIG